MYLRKTRVDVIDYFLPQFSGLRLSVKKAERNISIYRKISKVIESLARLVRSLAAFRLSLVQISPGLTLPFTFKISTS